MSNRLLARREKDTRTASNLMLLRVTVFALTLAGSVFPQTADLRQASPVSFPAQPDSNSPAFWSGGTFYLLDSTFYLGAAHVIRGSGSDQFHLGNTTAVDLAQTETISRWIESVWVDDNGRVYAWYSQEV